MTERAVPPSLLTSPLDRRTFLRRALLGAAAVAGAGGLSALLEACGSSTPAASSTSVASGASGLLAAAKKEGRLNTIALPSNWANYGTMISTFQSKYGITVNSESQDDSSAQENAALKALKGQPNEPDVVDVAPSLAVVGVQEGLYQPYKVPEWDTIPDNMKDPNGYWYGDYYGVISFGVDLSVVKNPPQTWDDLLKPEYKGMVSINGNPTSAGDAFAAVFAAALANGGSLDNIGPGIDFFVELKNRGNFNPTNCLPANIAKGTTPIAIEWDYLNIGYAKQFAGNPPFTTIVPPTGKFGNYYCQAISAFAPHPDAAKLWENFLYSDEGQLIWLAGYAHPARYNDLAARGVIPESLAKQLPPAKDYVGIVFPTVAQTNAAAAVLAQRWGPEMG